MNGSFLTLTRGELTRLAWAWHQAFHQAEHVYGWSGLAVELFDLSVWARALTAGAPDV